jgi:AcrR family transcriptional regulator
MAESQRQKQKNHTREHLIDAALNQFAKDGLAAARTSDIASAAKVSHGTVFAHFPTREILLDAVIEEFGIRMVKRLHELASGDCEMKELLRVHLKGIGEYEAFYTRLISERNSLHESARDSLVMIQSAVSFHLIQVAEREMEADKIRTMPVGLLFNTWVGLIHYYLVNGDLFAPGESVLERYGEQLAEHFMNLIRNSPA